MYVTHDQEEALAVSDRIAVMNNGVIQQIDTPARVYQRPANQFVANFIGLSNFLPAAVRRKGSETLLDFGDYQATMNNLKEDVADGQAVLAAVRPEEFELLEGEENGIPATVQSSVFLGTATHYFLKLESGQEIEATQSTDRWEIIPNGARLHLRVKPQKINVFTQDGTVPLVIREELL